MADNNSLLNTYFINTLYTGGPPPQPASTDLTTNLSRRLTDRLNENPTPVPLSGDMNNRMRSVLVSAGGVA